ncbi:MAG: ABC transporter ATP-binding protein/permease [Methanobrevibacter sp.]|jgi:ATP-binding cassette subfamily B protein|nr:ABC transporter ATP-binding protein/permease [Candidatus Methanovirga basalitermitum]
MNNNSSFKQNIKDLLKYIEDKKLLIFSFSLLLIANFILSYVPFVAGQITDQLSYYSNNKELGLYWNDLILKLLFLLVLYVVGNGTSIITNKIIMKISRKVSFRLRRDLENKLHKLPINYVDTRPGGNILSIVTSDIPLVENLVETSLVNLLVQTSIIILVMAMMLYLNQMLAIVYIILIPLTFFLMNFITSKTKTQFKKQQNTIGKLNGYVNDIFSNHQLIEGFTMEKHSKEEFKKLNKNSFDAYLNSRFISGFIIPLNFMINNIGYIFICLFGSISIINGSLTIGDFLAFLLYGQMLNTPLTSISTSMNNVQSGFAALERATDLLNEEEDIEKDDTILLDLNKVEGNIEFSHVEFGYTPDKVLFHDISLSVKKSMVIAIVGPSGAGKTTLVNLLMRFYDINSGKICLDGVDISNYLKVDLRKVFAVVLQDSWVFEGTIAENIGYGKKNATIEDIVNVSRIVGCDSFIDLLPDGYDTYISSEKSSLSVGEKQLLVLARTVIADPKILILDEATSQMDTRTETIVTKAMEELMKNRTTFVIAHRLFTIKNADSIIFMKDGDIKEVGNHEELLKLNGLYAEMYYSKT